MDLAKEMLQASKQVKSKLGIEVNLKISISCGTASGAVLGCRRYSFDLWGILVDTMEDFNQSISQKGGLYVTPTVWEMFLIAQTEKQNSLNNQTKIPPSEKSEEEAPKTEGDLKKPIAAPSPVIQVLSAENSVVGKYQTKLVTLELADSIPEYARKVEDTPSDSQPINNPPQYQRE
jgi:hypothetical protein